NLRQQSELAPTLRHHTPEASPRQRQPPWQNGLVYGQHGLSYRSPIPESSLICAGRGAGVRRRSIPPYYRGTWIATMKEKTAKVTNSGLYIVLSTIRSPVSCGRTERGRRQ